MPVDAMVARAHWWNLHRLNLHSGLAPFSLSIEDDIYGRIFVGYSLRWRKYRRILGSVTMSRGPASFWVVSDNRNGQRFKFD